MTALKTADEGVRWGFLGAGGVAGEFAAALRGCNGAELRAVCGRSADRTAAFAQAFGIPRAFTDLDEMLRDPLLDVIYVATPIELHHAHALQCLRAGKPVLVEKPLAMTERDAREVFDTARDRGLFCMEAMWMRFIPAMRRVLDVLASGEIGEPRMLTADFGIPVAYDPAAREFDPQRGGGALLDRGVYPISLAVSLFGEPTDICSRASLTETGVDRHVSVTLGFAGGRTAVLSAMLDGYGSNEAVIAGTRGRLRIHETLCRPDTISVSRRQPVARSPAVAAAQADGTSLGQRLKSLGVLKRLRASIGSMIALGGRREYIAYRGNGYGHEADEVMRCLREHRTESALMTARDTLLVQHIMDEARSQWPRR